MQGVAVTVETREFVCQNVIFRTVKLRLDSRKHTLLIMSSRVPVSAYQWS